MAEKIFQEAHESSTGSGIYLFSDALNWGPEGVPVEDDTIVIPEFLTCTYDLIPPSQPTISITSGSGSVVVTIIGTAGATHHLLYRGNDAEWQDGGSRVGDGDITVSGLSNNVNYFFMAYSEYGGLVSLASNAVDVTMTETADNDFDTILDDTASIWLEKFGETITYLPGSGGSRSILAIVNRPEASKISGLPHGSGAALIIEVANDVTTGISAAEVDRGRDKVQLPERFGDAVKTKRITNILAQDAGMIKLELQ